MADEKENCISRVLVNRPFIEYYNTLAERKKLSSKQLLDTVTAPVHCPRCFFVFSSKKAFSLHLPSCELEDSYSELKIENYYHPLCCNVPTHRCDVILKPQDSSPRKNEPCLATLTNNTCTCRYHKSGPRDIQDVDQFFLEGKLKINPEDAYSSSEVNLPAYEKITTPVKLKANLARKITKFFDKLVLNL